MNLLPILSKACYVWHLLMERFLYFAKNRWDEFVCICLYLSLPLESTQIQIGCIFSFFFLRHMTDRGGDAELSLCLHPESIRTIAIFAGIRCRPLRANRKPSLNKQTKPKIEGGCWANQQPRGFDHSFTCVCTSCFYIMFLNDDSVSPMHQKIAPWSLAALMVPLASLLPCCLCMPNRR